MLFIGFCVVLNIEMNRWLLIWLFINFVIVVIFFFFVYILIMFRLLEVGFMKMVFFDVLNLSFCFEF